MRINLNGTDTTVVTTDGWAANSHISGSTLTTIMDVLYTGEENQILIWKNGAPKWVNMPGHFEQYLAIVEHEQRKTT